MLGFLFWNGSFLMRLFANLKRGTLRQKALCGRVSQETPEATETLGKPAQGHIRALGAVGHKGCMPQRNGGARQWASQS